MPPPQEGSLIFRGSEPDDTMDVNNLAGSVNLLRPNRHQTRRRSRWMNSMYMISSVDASRDP